ncbi:MAG TPA: NAD-dependent epimerase/dehydratase family protein [Bacilli bacterium]
MDNQLSGSGCLLVTGCAGFIGFHLCKRLLTAGYSVVGIDSLTDYYDVSLKKARLRLLAPHSRFRFVHADLADRKAAAIAFAGETYDAVIHLAAQPGVRYSMERPHAYIDSNIVAFAHVLDAVRERQVRHFLFASSSSVYGADSPVPFSVHHPAEHPISLYAATKKSNELFAYAYSHLFGIPTTGLRFFTVYGPWGRPDMAYFIFAEKIMRGEAIDLYNFGDMRRDFTYIDDAVEAVMRILALPPAADAPPEAPEPTAREMPQEAFATGPDVHYRQPSQPPVRSSFRPPFRLVNVGKGKPDTLLSMVEILERVLGRRAEKRLLPLQPGDPVDTWADTSGLAALTGFTPQTSLEAGLGQFAEWYLHEYINKR